MMTKTLRMTTQMTVDMKTDNLIAQLAGGLEPVKRMSHPGVRMLGWIALALPVSLFLGAMLEDQNILFALERIQDPSLLTELIAIFATALTAGYAALCCAQPGRSTKAWMLPVFPFIAWLYLIGENCLSLYEQIGPDQFSFAPIWACFPAIATTGFAPALVMVILLRRGVLGQPTISAALAALAAAALGAVGLRLYHEPDATVMLLMWELIATITLMALTSLVFGYIYRRG
ncbi:MAG: hypothetical protein COB59_12535 [Rhodospirillaceae bacterium]|nr:MAG: hypothetical protein COB59_12535 [Rhodospirillaceae bacterium]